MKKLLSLLAPCLLLCACHEPVNDVETWQVTIHTMLIYPVGRNDSAIDHRRSFSLYLYQHFNINAIDSINYIGYNQDSTPFYGTIHIDNGKVIKPIKQYVADIDGVVVVDGLTKDKYITMQFSSNRAMTGYSSLFHELSRENAGTTIYDTLSIMR